MSNGTCMCEEGARGPWPSDQILIKQGAWKLVSFFSFSLFLTELAKLSSPDSVNSRKVLLRARPRYRFYSRHRDIGGIGPVPVPVTVVIWDRAPTSKNRKQEEQGTRSDERQLPVVWSKAAHRVLSLADTQREWAGCSLSLTHRRAAMGGCTQDDG
jgi:hypothetical protein